MMRVIDADPANLLPIEQVQIAAATDARKREYAAVRQLARALLSEFGLPPHAIPNLASRAPAFPPGVVASLSHSREQALAVMALERGVLTIGCDIETRDPLPAGVADHVLRPSERAALPACAAWFDRLFFSAKEAAFKAQHRLSGRFPEFHEIAITFDAEGRGFLAELCVDVGPLPHGTRFTGRAWIAREWIAAFAWQCNAPPAQQFDGPS